MDEASEKRSVGPADENMANDEHLVRQFRQGDSSAFEKIVAEYSADIATLANRLLGWGGNVEDVTQEVFLSAFLALKKFRGRSTLKT